MKKCILAFLLCSLCCIPSAFSQSFNKEKMDSLFDRLKAYNKSMGTVLVSHNNTIIYNRSIGFGRMEGNESYILSDKSRYRIGSITKMFTAVMVFQLIEEHKLTLSTLLSVYFPQIPNAGKINIGHLLSHQSGLYNYTNDWDNWRFKPQTQAQLIQLIADKQADFEPGTKTAYSNSNYLLLGYIIEKICKCTYSKAVKKRITSRIGLKDTYYGGRINIDNHEVYSYQLEQGGTWKKEPETDISAADGAGALVATAGDLLRFINALFSKKLFADSSLQQMLTVKDGEGYGIEQLPFYNKLVYGHSGTIDAFQSWLLYFPQDTLTVTYLSNGYGGFGINDILKGILHIYFNKPYDLPNFETIQLPASALGKYIGVYTCKQPAMKLTITQNGNTLMAQAEGQSAFSLEAIAPDKFQFTQAGIVIAFFPDKQELVLEQGGGKYVFLRE